jgi:hypothetical protein
MFYQLSLFPGCRNRLYAAWDIVAGGDFRYLRTGTMSQGASSNLYLRRSSPDLVAPIR